MEEVISVGQLNQKVSRLIEARVEPLWVRGEISNFTQASSGHWYFTLKDEQATVKAVMFRGRAALVSFTPSVGDQLEVYAQATLYAPRGDYQIQVEKIRRAGLGNLHEAFLALKAKLDAAGMFAPERKLAIPTMPRRIGVVTSLTTAALRDVLTALRRRLPHVEVIIYPALVQGVDAAPSICSALRSAVERNEVDTLLLVRGGGSFEDLWCFNDELLASYIVYSPIPIITGIGHETDFTIADFVADLRAPTPTAAAELAGYSYAQCQQHLAHVAKALARVQIRYLERGFLRVDNAMAKLVSPEQRLKNQRLTLQTAIQRILRAQAGQHEQQVQALRNLNQRLQRAVPTMQSQQADITRHTNNLYRYMHAYIKQQRQAIQALSQTLQALSPIHVLERGYAIVRDESGQIVRNALDLTVTEDISVQLAQGSVHATVTKTTAASNPNS